MTADLRADASVRAVAYAQQSASTADLDDGMIGGLARGFHDGYLAAAPLIEAQVRAQVAAELVNFPPLAAAIARGES